MQRNPLSAIAYFNLGETYFAARRFDDAVGAFRTMLEISPEFRGGHLWLSKSLLMAGDAQQACVEAGKEAFEPFRKLGRALCTYELGQMEEADATLAWMMEKGESKFPYDIGNPAMDPLFEYVLEEPQWANLTQALGKSSLQLDSIQFDVDIPDS